MSRASLIPVLIALVAWGSAVRAAEGEAPSQAKPLNPDVSLNGLFSLTQFNRDTPIVFDEGHDPRRNGFNLQQVELTLGAAVDPYFRGDANLIFLEDGSVEIEEAYATTLALPAGFQLIAGQFFTRFGRINPTHPHAWDFANKPLVASRFFGGDGLRNPGAQLSWLTPLPWYSELIASAQNSTGALAVSFNPGGSQRSARDLLAMLRWVNFVSLGESASVNLGVSCLNGPNASAQRTRIEGVDLFVKWRPIEGLSYFSLQAEAMRRRYNTGSDDLVDWGSYAQVAYRFGEGWGRWQLALRGDWVGAPRAPVYVSTLADPAGPITNVDGAAAFDLDPDPRYRISPNVTFFPTEFSKVRLQYDRDKPSGLQEAQQAVSLQLEFVLGAHGAHKI